MGVAEIISLAVFVVLIVGIWVKLNINIKGLEVEMRNLTLRQNEFENRMTKKHDDYEVEASDRLEKLEELNREEHKEIGAKLDNVIEKITDVAINVAKIKN